MTVHQGGGGGVTLAGHPALPFPPSSLPFSFHGRPAPSPPLYAQSQALVQSWTNSVAHSSPALPLLALAKEWAGGAGRDSLLNSAEKHRGGVPNGGGVGEGGESGASGHGSWSAVNSVMRENSLLRQVCLSVCLSFSLSLARSLCMSVFLSLSSSLSLCLCA